MHKKLILEVFEKAKTEEEKQTGMKASKSRLSERISETLLNDYKCVFGEKSLRILYSHAMTKSKEDVTIKQTAVLESLCKYLGYQDYIDFVNNSPEPKKRVQSIHNKKDASKIRTIVSNHKLSFVLGFLLIILLVFYSTRKQRWMVWEKNQYVEVAFDIEKYNLNQLKIYKEERIATFKKVNLSCDIKFFDKKGQVKIWYGKNLKGDLEIFTSLGLHPETGKTLKPISKYMIDKYICSNSSHN